MKCGYSCHLQVGKHLGIWGWNLRGNRVWEEEGLQLAIMTEFQVPKGLFSPGDLLLLRDHS